MKSPRRDIGRNMGPVFHFCWGPPNDVLWNTEPGECPISWNRTAVSGFNRVFDNEKVEIAIGLGIPTGPAAEQNNSVRIYGGNQTPNDFLNQILINGPYHSVMVSLSKLHSHFKTHRRTGFSVRAQLGISDLIDAVQEVSSGMSPHQKISAQKLRYSQSANRPRTVVGSGKISRPIMLRIEARAERASEQSSSVMAKRKVTSSVVMKMNPAGTGLEKCAATRKAYPASWPALEPSFCREYELRYSEPVTEPIKTVPGYQWIVADSDLLGGQRAVKGTRLSVSHILACLAEGMSGEDIARDYPGFPPESVPEILRLIHPNDSELPNLPAG